MIEDLRMRKLAVIERIKGIEPIAKADNLEAVIIKGWTVVVKKGEFKVGDLVVYCEIDSFLPIREEFEFLRASSYRKMGEKEGFRIKTAKLRGQLSQGIVFAISLFPELQEIDLKIETDVTEILGINKYETPIPLSLTGEVIGSFPSKIKKTDQERIQNLWDEYSIQFKEIEFEESLKLDGTSMSVYYLDGHVGVCSRNWELKESNNNSYWLTVHKLNLQDKLISLNKNLALQGELMVPGIQGNKEKLDEIKLFIFDIWDIDNQKYLSSQERLSLIKYLDLLAIPCSYPVKIFSECSTLEELLNRTNGKSLNAKQKEGNVYKSLYPLDGELISFKVINNNYLLKNE